eukprot:282319-Chlamydomonas_euryale.AAC.1
MSRCGAAPLSFVQTCGPRLWPTPAAQSCGRSTIHSRTHTQSKHLSMRVALAKITTIAILATHATLATLVALALIFPIPTDGAVVWNSRMRPPKELIVMKAACGTKATGLVWAG